MGKVPYDILLVQLLIIFTVVFAAAIICTIIPARNASRMPPARQCGISNKFIRELP
jgi:ABC-type lipoprotein release transport system permease subunit